MTGLALGHIDEPKYEPGTWFDSPRAILYVIVMDQGQ